MFIKGELRILILIFTTVVLMTHAVIPHHHHSNNEIFIINPEISPENQDHYHGNCDADDHHDKTEDDFFCILQKIIIARPDNSEQESKFLKFTEHQSFKFRFIFLYNENNPDFYLATIYKEFDNLLIAPKKSSFVPLTIGLRAPPLA